VKAATGERTSSALQGSQSSPIAADEPAGLLLFQRLALDTP
jgi:hypothetical protein